MQNSSTKQSKLDALELLERQRRGEKVDIGVKEDEPLFEEVDEEEYKRTRKGGFVVDAESDEEYESDQDFIDDEFHDDDEESSSRDNKKRGSKRRRKEVEADPRQRSMKSFLGGSSKFTKSLGMPSMLSPKSKKPEVNQDEILSQMLFDVPINRASSAKKPVKVLSRLPQTSTSNSSTRPLKTKANFEITNNKRPRMASPTPADNFNSGLDDWHNDEFDDDLPQHTEPSTNRPATKDTIFEQMATQESVTSIEQDDIDDTGIEAAPLDDDLKSNLEFHSHGDKQYTRLYWYDCCEDQTKSPGVVYFFGRIYAVTAKRYVSCCTIVKNVKKTCYLLIKHDCTYQDALGEFTHIIAKRFNIKNFTCEKATKKYAFSSNVNVPPVAEYVKVDYPATQSVLPADLKGETFSCVLNTNQSPMEKIILDLKLRGPCWLRLIDPVASTSPLTWTRIELVLESPANLLVEENMDGLKPPYFCVLSLALQTHAHPTIPGRNDIVAISVMVNTTFNLDECLKRTNKASGHFLLMAKPTPSQKDPLKLPYDFQAVMKKYNKTRFELVNNERDLLLNFMEKFNNIDPDIVVGHDLLNFDFETLVKQMSVNKVGLWSQLGRFKRTTLVSTKKAFPYLFSGRVLCDIKRSAEELIQSRSYDLTELTLQILDKKRVEYNHITLVESFKTSDGLVQMLNATWEDVDSIFSILVELNIIPLALKITNITGNILSRTLAAGRSERNEYLLLHAFHEDNFICPEKQTLWGRRALKGNDNKNEIADSQPQGRRKPAYTGGLVLEPKAGFYETCVLLMDFNSLYPSIIQEFNICFSTVKVPESLNENEGDAEIIASIPDDSVGTGVLPTQLKNLVDRRRQVKRLMADCKQPMQKLLLDIEQRALKLTANSMYGCLGFEHSRFYAKHLASLVTFKGREILMSTKAMVEKLGYEVIYGDTDSLMIDTKIIEYDEVIQRGNAIKGEINRTFKLLEIDIDGVYRPLLLLKKKNYAGASVKKVGEGQLVKTIETKGLDTVRRDRAVIAKEAGERILSMILESDKDICQIVEDIHNYLKQLGASITAGELPAEKFLISKQLNKNPEEYKDTKGIGHVSVALRHNSDPRKTRKMRSGDTVEYVICLDNTTETANQRCYSVEELKSQPELKLDYEYYLCQQIHPVITRICDKLPVTNAYVLAEMLGVESSHLLHIRHEQTGGSKRDQLISKGDARFHSCQPFVIQCPNCNLPDEITSRTRKNKENKVEFSLAKCSQCNIRYPLKSKQIVVQVIATIKRLTVELYSSKFVCENADCENKTRNVFGPLTSDENGVSSLKAQPICELCQSAMVAEMDDRKMDLQLGFMKHLFDIHRERDSSRAIEPSEDLIDMYEKCHQEVSDALRMSFVNNIDARSMFSMVCSGRN